MFNTGFGAVIFQVIGRFGLELKIRECYLIQ